MSPFPQFMFEALTLSVMVLEGGGLWEVIKFRWGHEGRARMMGLVTLWEEEDTRAILSPL